MKDFNKYSSSRQIFIKNNKVIKFYPKIYGYIFHEIFRILFQIFNGVYKIDFVSRKKRILNEIYGRKILNKFKVQCTKITYLSTKDYFLEEIIENGAISIYDAENIDVDLASKYAKKVGEITRKLNDENYYFIDNRASNWLIGDDIIRTDLELFRYSDSYKSFYAKCDYLSFLSSIKKEKVKRSFIEGYGMEIKYHPFTEFLVKLYVSITEFLF
jgi:tRNA A-37 threonylcarbamoyl transferase component Bud32